MSRATRINFNTTLLNVVEQDTHICSQLEVRTVSQATPAIFKVHGPRAQNALVKLFSIPLSLVLTLLQFGMIYCGTVQVHTLYSKNQQNITKSCPHCVNTVFYITHIIYSLLQMLVPSSSYYIYVLQHFGCSDLRVAPIGMPNPLLNLPRTLESN